MSQEKVEIVNTDKIVKDEVSKAISRDRERIAKNGYEYAIQLKGEERLKESIMHEIYIDALNNKNISD